MTVNREAVRPESATLAKETRLLALVAAISGVAAILLFSYTALPILGYSYSGGVEVYAERQIPELGVQLSFPYEGSMSIRNLATSKRLNLYIDVPPMLPAQTVVHVRLRGDARLKYARTGVGFPVTSQDRLSPKEEAEFRSGIELAEPIEASDETGLSHEYQDFSLKFLRPIQHPALVTIEGTMRRSVGRKAASSTEVVLPWCDIRNVTDSRCQIEADYIASSETLTYVHPSKEGDRLSWVRDGGLPNVVIRSTDDDLLKLENSILFVSGTLLGIAGGAAMELAMRLPSYFAVRRQERLDRASAERRAKRDRQTFHQRAGRRRREFALVARRRLR